MRKIIPYGRQEITQQDIDEVVKTLRSDFIAQGPRIEKFEKAFADFCGVKYALATSNGTTALHLAVKALSANKKGKVITTPITFAASANCVLYCGLEIDFVDINSKTFLIDVDLLENKIKKNPNDYQGIIPVSFAGYPVNIEEIRKVADKYGLWILEDACHSPGATYTDSSGNVQKSGNSLHADISVFSFHPVKHIACGEGGMITTNNEALHDKITLLRTHGITKDHDLYLNDSHGGWYHEMQELGYNYRLTDIQAALGASQLTRMDANLEKRNSYANKYDELLKDYSILLPYRSKDIFHAFHLYVVQIEERLKMYDYLKYRGIICQVHYIPVYLHPYYQKLGFSAGLCPKAEAYYSKCLSLPMYHSMNEGDFKFIIDNVRSFFDR